MSEQVKVETETIIWDLDGTLIDSFAVFTEVLADILPGHNQLVPAREVLAQNFHGSLSDSINNVLGGVPPQVLDRIVADFLDKQNGYYEVIDHHIFEDALDLARRAHEAGVQQIVVTNRQHVGRLNASPRHIVENSLLSGFIDEVVCGDDSEHRKPNPEVIQVLLDSGKVVLENTAVIGDQFVDAEFARNLGARAILINRGSEPIVHLDRLGDGWEDKVSIVPSLNLVQFQR